ncbi:hypothetical protein KFL_002760120 [Klebsormidium nitens]|uniref:Uncharacterized protein n=1 Tax=Klebsormidium nitens TaxID=105231 RepID=A0A1Y1I5I6_KLENI|nr:hypothetical protein KFL_002760120 [Klebsormidium nitens]|eukprot:GAQ86215.1 hypothetical protein KFL_002760120 [Klebsormidium nitens]
MLLGLPSFSKRGATDTAAPAPALYRRQIQQARHCFTGITSLDISDVLHCKGEDALVYAPPKLLHLGQCFPNVRRLTCNFGLKRWITGGLPFLGIWTTLEEVVVKQLDHSIAPESLVDCIGTGTLIMTNLNRLSSLGQAWLPLKKGLEIGVET